MRDPPLNAGLRTTDPVQTGTKFTRKSIGPTSWPQNTSRLERWSTAEAGRLPGAHPTAASTPRERWHEKSDFVSFSTWKRKEEPSYVQLDAGFYLKDKTKQKQTKQKNKPHEQKSKAHTDLYTKKE